MQIKEVDVEKTEIFSIGRQYSHNVLVIHFVNLPNLKNKYIYYKIDDIEEEIPLVSDLFIVSRPLTMHSGKVKAQIIVRDEANETIDLTKNFTMIIKASNYSGIGEDENYPDDLNVKNYFVKIDEKVNSFEELANLVQTKLDNGEFIGAQGPKGDPGDVTEEYRNLAMQIAQNASDAQTSAINAQTSASNAQRILDDTKEFANQTKSEMNQIKNDTELLKNEVNTSAVNAKASENKAKEYADKLQISTDDISQLKEDLDNLKKITSTNSIYEIAVGGFDSTTLKFNDDSNYIHSKHPFPISNNNFTIMENEETIKDLRFSVFYDKKLKIVDYAERSIPPEKVEAYPYINIVLQSTYQNKQIEVICDDTRGRIDKKIDSVNDRLKEDTDYSLVTGGFDKTTGEFNKDTNYLYSNDFIPIKNNVLSVTDLPLQTLTQIRFIVYYDSLKRYKTYSEFKIDQEKVNQYSYAKVVLYKDNIDEGLCISGDSDVEGDVQKRISDAVKDISVLNTASDICNYRYIMTSFGDSGKKGLFILGSNDLKHFNLLNGYNPFIPKENVGLRDPSIAFIDGWYYIVYTIAVGVYVTNQIGLVRTKNFVEWDELPNLTIVSDQYDFSKGYCWAPCFFRNEDEWYIISGCCTDSNTQEFLHRIMRFDVGTKTIGKAFTTNIPFIDGHIYKENGTYYCLTSQGKLYKSQSLLSTEYVLVPDKGLNFRSYEGQYAIRKDDGTYRVFGQKVLNESVGNTDSLIYYQDGGTSLESNFGERKLISYDSDTLKYVSKRWQNKNGIFWHPTIYDRYCFRDNNNNY